MSLQTLNAHFNQSNLFYELQHGFRQNRSCQTQLLMLIDDLLLAMNLKSQVDLILLDFSKAFDKVNHTKLIYKLHFYGIRGETLTWIKSFLDNRSQSVILNGAHSDIIDVASGVPQGSVLGPLLFLIYINDLPEHVSSSKVRLFADDTAIYLSLTCGSHSQHLQHDLHELEKWELLWDMSFNPSKCQCIHITKRRDVIDTTYSLHNTQLESVPSAKYLGVTISNDLTWNTHIDNITKTANQTLGFLRRNIKIHSEPLKSTVYKTLVRPQLEYCSPVWSPHTDTNVHQIESIQRRAARWVKHDYSRTSSVTNMLTSLEWRRLDLRRIDQRLIQFYKITNSLVAIPVPAHINLNQRSCRSSNNLAYRTIHSSSDYYKYSFYPRTIVHWNSLPHVLSTFHCPSSAWQSARLNMFHHK